MICSVSSRSMFRAGDPQSQCSSETKKTQNKSTHFFHPLVADHNYQDRNKQGLKKTLFNGRKEGNILFNDALNTFYLQLYGFRLFNGTTQHNIQIFDKTILRK